MKIELDIDSTALGDSGCIRKLFMTVAGSVVENRVVGGFKELPSASIIYGVAVHKFIDTMYKTGGHYPTARKDAELAFNVPKRAPSANQGHLGDPTHMITTCYNLWTNKIEEEYDFGVIKVPIKCYHCKGTGTVQGGNNDGKQCDKCGGCGIVKGPATEITFKLPFYEDDVVKINLCGTIDRVGQYKGGCFAIRDWKTSSQFKQDKYLSSYEMNRQLRIYTLACKMMAAKEPDSILGRIGATRMGANIDAIFIKPKANDNQYGSTEVFTYDDNDLLEVKAMIFDQCRQLSIAARVGKWNEIPRTGLINGTCDGKWGKCKFWNVCKNPHNVGEMLLARDFKRKLYNPLAFNE